MMLQVFYEIKEERKKAGMDKTPDLSKIRPAIFWDTDMLKIDWLAQKKQLSTEYGNVVPKKKKRRLHAFMVPRR